MIGQTVSHYRVEQKIGGGGMGVVYRAIDERLGRPVALKLLPEEMSRDPQAVERFQREARAASALNHPNICTIYDVGDFEGEDGESRAFLAMEYMEGQTLKHRIDGGPLPTDQLLELAVQITEGLAAAHEAGIIHRDLKPANLFVTKHGHAKILDFGLAKLTNEDGQGPSPLSDVPTRTSPEPLTEAGVAMGTVAYMSPEQARGEELDHRTDVFSLGAVLYEMATGKQPFAGPTAAVTHAALLGKAPTPPVALNPEIPAELQTVILKCLEKDPALRYQTAAGLRGDLVRLRRDSEATRTVAVAPPAPASSTPSSRTVQLATGALALLGIVAAVVFWPRKEAVALTEADPVLLTAFDNRTGDPVFDETLLTALAVKIDESPLLTVVSEQRVREALELMQREPHTRLDEELGREICRRLELKAMIHGTVAAIGEQHLVTLHTLGCADGETLARVQREAPSREGVLAALGDASTQLREDLGESLQSVAEFDTPIERATTPSLEALEAYSRGWTIWEARGGRQAIPHFERAIELDPGFAMAHRKLSTIFENSWQTGKARHHATLAYEHRNRATTPERLAIDAVYHWTVTGNLKKEIEALQILSDAYPSFSIGLLNLGVTYRETGQFEKALEIHELARQQSSVDDRLTLVNLARDNFYLGRTEEARRLSELLDPPMWFIQLSTAALDRDEAAAEELADPSRPGRAYNYAELLAQWGRLADALDWMELGYEGATREGQVDLAGAMRATNGWYHLELGNDPATAIELARAALEDSRGVRALHRAGLTLAAAGLTDEARAIAAEMSELQPEGTIMQQARVPHVLAMIEFKAGRPAEALDLLEASRPFKALWSSIPAAILRGRALLESGDPAGAEAAFLEAGELRYVWANRPHHALVPLYLARARAAQGKTAEARESYDELFDLWRDADPDFPLLLEAQREYAALGAE